MKKPPLVSLIIPNYNKAAYILETLKSVQNQSFTDWEVIVVDDNSEDDSIEIVDKILYEDDRFSLFINKSGVKGGSVCRNIGLKKAAGKFVVFLDSDDLLSSDCLKKRVLIMESNKALDFAVFPMQNFYNNIGDSSFIWNNFEGDHLKRFLKHELPWQTMMPIWNKTSLERLNGFNELFPRLQDVEFHTRALLLSDMNYLAFSGLDPDCFFRINENRITSKKLDFLANWMEGSGLYINFFYNFLVEAEKVKYIKYLRGSLVAFLANLSYEYRVGNITRLEFKKIWAKFLNDKGTLEVSNGFTKFLLKIYFLFCIFSINKIKGVNYLFRTLIVI